MHMPQSRECHRVELIKNALMVDPIKVCVEINQLDPFLLATIQSTLHCMGRAQKCNTARYPDLSDKHTGWLEAHHCVP